MARASPDGVAPSIRLPAFGPGSVGRVEPPSLAQVILRARARLAERERLGAKLLWIAMVCIAIPFAIDAMGLTGVITAQARLTTSPLLRDTLVDWSRTLVDTAAVLAELVLILACMVGASRFGAGRPKGAWMLSLLGAGGFVIWLPVVYGVALEVFPTDIVGALMTSIFPGLGLVGSCLLAAGGLEARLRPVRPYDR